MESRETVDGQAEAVNGRAANRRRAQRGMLGLVAARNVAEGEKMGENVKIFAATLSRPRPAQSHPVAGRRIASRILLHPRRGRLYVIPPRRGARAVGCGRTPETGSDDDGPPEGTSSDDGKPPACGLRVVHLFVQRRVHGIWHGHCTWELDNRGTQTS